MRGEVVIALGWQGERRSHKGVRIEGEGWRFTVAAMGIGLLILVRVRRRIVGADQLQKLGAIEYKRFYCQVWTMKTVPMTIEGPLIPELGAGLDRGVERKIPSPAIFRGGRRVGIGCDEAHLAHLSL